MQEGDVFSCTDGIWRFIPPGRLEYFSKFMLDYQRVRQAEGRGGNSVEYYRRLPFVDSTDPRSDDWKIRKTSFTTFIDRVLRPLEVENGFQLKCLDVGAGNGWLSNQLAQRGHWTAAVDLIVNNWDGLGTIPLYEFPILPLQAEYDRLPLADHQCDLVVFNASLHYSLDYQTSLKEACRVLKSSGKIIILDTPIYQQAESGNQMVLERQNQFSKLYGFPSNSLDSENFLTFSRIQALSNQVGIQWNLIEPAYGFKWALRFWKAKILGTREPAKFMIVVGKPISEESADVSTFVKESKKEQ